MFKTNRACWQFGLVIVILCHITCSSTAAAQDQNNLAEMPDHAIWRIGEFGKITKANGIYRLVYSDDGRLLASRNRENVVSIYDTQTRKKLCEVMGHDNNWIETVDFSPDSRLFMTAAADSSENVKIWDTQTGKLIDEIETDARAAYFSDDGNNISILGGTHVEFYSWPGVQLLSREKWRTNNEMRSALSQDGNLVAVYRSVNRRNYQTQILDLKNKSKIELAGPTSIPKLVTISPDNNWVAATHHRDSKIYLWDLRDPHNSKYILQKHKETVQSLSFSPDNRFLLSSGWDETAVMWDLLTRAPLGEFSGHTEHVNATAISPLDFTFATGASGSEDNSIVVWDLKDILFKRPPIENEKTFNQLWNGLGASSLELSLASTNQLIGQHEKFLGEIAKQVADKTSASNQTNFVDLIKQLDDPRYRVRESATQQLSMARVEAENQLRAAAKKSNSAEVRYRINRILKQPHRRPKINFTELRRWHRIILALEMINSEPATKILTRISDGHPDRDVARDAKAAMKRNLVRAGISQKAAK